MLSRIDFSGVKEASRFLDAIRRKLINPEVEAKATADYIEKTVIPRRFEDQKGPTGSPWTKLSDIYLRWKRKKYPSNANKILTLSGKLRHGLKPVINIGSNGVNIHFKPSKETEMYAYVHNNGGRIKNKSGRYTTMPKRQYAYTTQQEKMIIMRDIWIKGLMSA